jgi:tetratricopeptide (TPR) repeat protein
LAKQKTGDRRRATTPARAEQRTFDTRLAAILAILIAVTLAVFYPVSHFDFVQWDDNLNITDNYLYRPLATDHLRELWTIPYYSAYIPVTRILWAFLAGSQVDQNGVQTVVFDPHIYHLANLIVHLLNVVLVFLILRLLLRAERGAGTSGDVAAAGGALLFAVHPLQVEPVAWVTGMKDVLCGFFSLLTVWLYLLMLGSLRSAKTGASAGWVYAGSCAAYVLALLSKSAAVTLPFILLLLDCLYAGAAPTRIDPAPALPASGEGARLAAIRTSPPSGITQLAGGQRGIYSPRYRAAGLLLWLLAAVPIVLMTKHAEQLAGIRIPMVALWKRPFVAGDTYSFYLEKMLLPFSLGPDYGRRPTWLMKHGWAYAMPLIPIALGVLARCVRRKAVWPMAALGIFVLSVLPVSGLTPFDFQAYSTVADRYVYLAMLGAALALAGALSMIPVRAALVTSAVVAGALAWVAALQVPVWRNTTTLFTQGLHVNPRSSVSYASLGFMLDNAGQLDAAIVDYREAILLNPQSEQAQNDMGQALGKKWSQAGQSPAARGYLLEAEQHLEESIRLRENFPEGHKNLGNVYYALGRYADAIYQFKDALKYNPDDDSTYLTLAAIYKQIGDTADSTASYQKAADLGNAVAKRALGL